MKSLFERIRFSKNGKEFMITRERISKICYVIMMITYGIFWWLKTPDNVPLFTFYITYLLIPILTFGLFQRNYYYLFVYNWFYVLFNIVTTILFVSIMCQFNPSYETPVLWEIGHLVVALFVGSCVSIAVSFPFKLIQTQLMDVTFENFYFDSNTLEELDKVIFSEKYEKKKQEKKESMKFDTLNETQLQAELSVALKEERFEDAEKIKKILETKFR